MNPNLKAARYCIVQSQMACGACDRLTAVFALALPAGYSRVKKKRGAMAWTTRKTSALLAFVEDVSPAVAARIQGLTPHYRPDRGRRMHETRWVNHCEHCGTLLADDAVHKMELELGEGPFDVLSDPTFQVHDVPEPFEGYAIEACTDPGVLRKRQ